MERDIRNNERGIDRINNRIETLERSINSLNSDVLHFDRRFDYILRLIDIQDNYNRDFYRRRRRSRSRSRSRSRRSRGRSRSRRNKYRIRSRSKSRSRSRSRSRDRNRSRNRSRNNKRSDKHYYRYNEDYKYKRSKERRRDNTDDNVSYYSNRSYKSRNHRKSKYENLPNKDLSLHSESSSETLKIEQKRMKVKK
jgi:hypothetical protein